MNAISASAKKAAKKKAAELLAGGTRRIEYVPVQDLVSAARNPKKHADADIDKSVGRFGFTEPILMDERTGRLVAGHGRVASLLRLRDKGQQPPEGVVLQAGGWLVPVVRGWASRSDREADAYLLASNQLTIAGGWDEDALEEMLKELQEAQALEGVGWSEGELEKLLDSASGVVPYTDKIESPVYKPTGEKPKVSELYDTEKLRKLTREIDEATEISEEEPVFLRMAAQRHVVFDYQNIAEFYAHAPPATQRLMEKSALVIIDFKQAIENGFVKLTNDISEGLEEDEA